MKEIPLFGKKPVRAVDVERVRKWRNADKMELKGEHQVDTGVWRFIVHRVALQFPSKDGLFQVMLGEKSLR